MKQDISIYAVIAREYLRKNRVYRYGMKRVVDMDDGEVMQKCHFWYTENHMEDDFRTFERKMLIEAGIVGK